MMWSLATCAHREGRRGRRNDRRGGFVLLAVLWAIVGLASVALALDLAGRDAVAAARNRTSLERARWRAEGCVELARAVVADALGQGDRADASWRALDRLLAASPLVAESGCALEARAAGSALDVNAADGDALRRLFLATGQAPERADSLADAILDWRDADDDPRAVGAERAWYLAAHRFLPRNAPFADARELARVRGVDSLLRVLPGLDSLLDVEPGRVVLARAPLAVLAALPGMTPVALLRIAELRAAGAMPTDALALAGAMPPSARDSLAAHFAELAPLVTADPDAWIVTARAADGAPAAEATVELRLVRAGARAAVVRRRSWP